MAVDPITGGLIGWVCGKFADKALNHLVSNHQLTRDIENAVAVWAKFLGDEKFVIPGALFGSIDPLITKADRPKYCELQKKLINFELPPKQMWHGVLMERWEYVRKTVKQPQSFFLLAESQASEDFERLAEMTFDVCIQYEKIFKKAVIGKLDVLDEKLDSIDGYMREHLTGQREVEIEGLKVSLSKLPTTGHELFGREEELETLHKAWDDEHTNILSLVAWGGVGKTALVNKWLNQMGLTNYRGAGRVYGWSFYSQGTREERQVSADEFLAYALKWFGDPDPKEGSTWDKGIRLAELIRKQKTLLILDGMEPLQYPPGPVQGKLKDQGLQALLKELGRSNPGLCIITTREKVEDLEHIDDPALVRIFLDNLSVEAGVELLKSLRVKGTNTELEKAVGEFGGHALALNLLGTYLATVYEGEIRKRDLVSHLTDEEEQGGHAKRVMESYEIWLKDNPELDILYMMGLFDRPAPGGAIGALRAELAIEGLTDKLQGLTEAKWKFALKHLRDLRLLAKQDENEPDKLDCHPLIREHFGEKLQKDKPEAWKEAHGKLYEYYKSVPDKELPDTIEEMEPLFAAVTHGSLAGRYQETYDDVYWKRILRGNEKYIVLLLGAFGADLAAVSCFFEKPWNKPVSNLRDRSKAAILNCSGFALRSLGRWREATEPLQATLEETVRQEDWTNAAIDAGNLSELYLGFGDMSKAIDYARKSVDFIDRTEENIYKVVLVAALADSLHHSGKLSDAKELFGEAEEMQEKETPMYPYLYSHWGFRFCDLLLSQGEYKDVQERAKHTLEWAHSLHAKALDKLSLGRAHLLEAMRKGKSKKGPSTALSTGLVKAEDLLNRAVDGLREAGLQDHLPRGLLARAVLYRYQRSWEKAWRDLEAAKEIAERGEMNLFLADYHLEAARVCLAEQGKEKDACEHYKEAKKRVDDMGYHRRDPEVLLIQAELEIVKGDKKSARETLGMAKKLIDKMGCHRWDVEVERLKELLKKAVKTR